MANLLFLVKYIERWGTGTNDIIKWCREEDLPEPIFKEVTGGFAVVLRKFQIPENLESLELNERQKKAIEYISQKNKITNNEYRKLFPGITDRTVLNDLRDMVKKGILVKVGKTKNTFYQFRNNSEIIPK